jgi:hypothetical protein
MNLICCNFPESVAIFLTSFRRQLSPNNIFGEQKVDCLESKTKATDLICPRYYSEHSVGLGCGLIFLEFLFSLTMKTRYSEKFIPRLP